MDEEVSKILHEILDKDKDDEMSDFEGFSGDREEMTAFNFVSIMCANYLKTLEYNSPMAVYSLRDIRGRLSELSPSYCKYFDKIRSEADKNSTFVMVNDYIKQKEFNELIDCFCNDIARQNKNDDFVIFESIKFISEMLDMNYYESLILQFYYLLNSDLSYDLAYVITELPPSDESLAQFFAKCFKAPVKEFEKILTAENGLFASGLLETNPRFKNHYKIIYKVQDLLGPNTILTDSVLEARLFPSILDTNLKISDYHQQEDIATMTSMINKSLETNQTGINVLLWGLPGVGKTELPLVVAKEHGWELKVVGDIGKLDTNEKARNERLLALNVAQRLFAHTTKKIVLLFDEMEDLFKFDQNAQHSKAFINRIIEKTPVPIIWTTNNMQTLGSAVIRRMTFNIPFHKVPPASVRKNIWNKYIEQYDLNISKEKVESLSRNFDVVPALIANVAKIANLSGLNEDQLSRVLKNLDMAMNLGEEREFDEDEKTESKFKIEFTNTNYDLNKITNRILETKKANFSILSYGPSGTGKSAFGIYLSDKMEMKYKIKKASDLLSMWVGGTEKNIAAMFEEAMDSNLFLILDEADSFFQNRGSAHQSWEVTQVNEMLVQMEKHKLPFVCTTNIEESIDPAAFRRFTFKIGYNYLNLQQRYDIYEHYFSKPAPEKSLDNLLQLAPGDFANIFDKTAFLGELGNVEILEMLKDECEIKPSFRRKIGF